MSRQPEIMVVTKGEMRQLLLALDDDKEYKYIAEKIRNKKELHNADWSKMATACARRLAVLGCQTPSNEQIEAMADVISIANKCEEQRAATSYYLAARPIML